MITFPIQLIQHLIIPVTIARFPIADKFPIYIRSVKAHTLPHRGP